MNPVASFALSLSMCCTSAVAFPTLDSATGEFRAGRWSAAYGQFFTLANSGNAEAARVALFMLRYGAQFYDTHWDASDDDVELWTTMTMPRSCARAGSGAEHLMVARAAPKPPPRRVRSFQGRSAQRAY